MAGEFLAPTEVISMMWGYDGGAAIVVGVAVLLRSGLGSGVGSARRILDERFARGEIDEDEFNRRVAALRSR